MLASCRYLCVGAFSSSFGLSYQSPGDYAAHLNTNRNGKNDGTYVPVGLSQVGFSDQYTACNDDGVWHFQTAQVQYLDRHVVACKGNNLHRQQVLSRFQLVLGVNSARCTSGQYMYKYSCSRRKFRSHCISRHSTCCCRKSRTYLCKNLKNLPRRSTYTRTNGL